MYLSPIVVLCIKDIRARDGYMLPDVRDGDAVGIALTG
jgi:hypothetical protein